MKRVQGQISNCLKSQIIKIQADEKLTGSKHLVPYEPELHSKQLWDVTVIQQKQSTWNKKCLSRFKYILHEKTADQSEKYADVDGEKRIRTAVKNDIK